MKEIREIGLWGRSMGAMTALLYLGKTIDVKCVILDSPYKHLKSYIEENLKKNWKVPSLVVGGAVKIVAKTIEEKSGLDIANVNPIKYTVPGLHVPALFILPSQDGNQPEGMKQLYQQYGGELK